MVSPNSSEQTLFSQVDRVIRTVLNINGRPIQPAMALVADLGAESIDFLDISCELEKEVDVEVDFRKLLEEKRARTGAATADISVQDIIEYVQARSR